jgi:putative thioredoxin
LVHPIAADSQYFDIAEAIRTFADLFDKANHPEKLPEDGVKPIFVNGIRKLQESDFAGALEAFIEVIRTNRYYDDDAARKACVAIFKILGEDNEITQRYRREFSRALY